MLFRSLNLLGEKAGLEFFEIEVKQVSLISHHENRNPTLDSSYNPIYIVQKGKLPSYQLLSFPQNLKKLLLNLMPIWIRFNYYKLFRKNYGKPFLKHSTIFVVYKNK